jgi:Ca2+-binding RTX toxin-like protein
MATPSTLGTVAVNLTGNEFNNTLVGNAAANSLNGGAGADLLYGEGGNDTYYVDNVGDRVYEAAGGGTDTVIVIGAITYALLPGQQVENMDGPGSASTLAVNLTGNEFNNTIVGTAASNVLTGGGGADLLYGEGGSDRFVYNAITDSQPGAGKFDRIADFTPGSGATADKIDFAAPGVSTIQGLITPASPSETPPTTGLNAHSIAWYQVGSETVVIADAGATAGHVDMEIVLNGVTASKLSKTSGVNFIPDSSAQASMALFVQASAAGLGDASHTAAATTPVSSAAASQETLLTLPHHS